MALSIGDIHFIVGADTSRLGGAEKQMKRFGRSAEKVAKSQGKLGKQTANTTHAFRNLESATVLAVGPLSGIGARLRSFGAILTRTGSIMAAVAFGALAALTLGLFKLGQAAIEASLKMERIEARFRAGSNSAAEAASRLNFVRKTADKLGLSLISTAEEFSLLTAATRGTSAEGEATRQIFLGIVNAAAALKLSNEQVVGAFRAIQQMASKGTVQSEELRQQLAERIPGAVNLTARALGKTTRALNKMLEDGLLPAEELFRKLGPLLIELFSEQAIEQSKRLAANLNRLGNTKIEFFREFDRLARVSDITNKAVIALNETLKFMTRNMRQIAFNSIVVAGALTGMVTSTILTGLWSLVAVIWNAARGLATIGTIIAAWPAKKLVAVLLKFGVVLAGAVAAGVLFKDILEDIDKEIVALSESADEAGEKLKLGIDPNALTILADAANKAAIKLALMEGVLGDLSPTTQGVVSSIKGLVSGILKARDAGKAGEDQLKEFADAIKLLEDRSFEVDSLTQLEKIFDNTRTEAEKLGAEIDKLDKLRDFTKGHFLTADKMFPFLDALDRQERLLLRNKRAAFEFGDAFVSAFEDAIIEAESLREVLKALLQDIARIILRNAITEPLGALIQGTVQGLFSKTPATAAKGLAFMGGRVQALAKGGILRGPTAFPIKGGIAIGGEAGNEGVLPLTRTAKGDLGVSALGFGGGGTQITIIDQRGTNAPPIEITRGAAADGRQAFKILVRSEVSEAIGDGSLDKSLASSFGLGRRAI